MPSTVYLMLRSDPAQPGRVSKHARHLGLLDRYDVRASEE
jgi:hypothetical protein